VPDASHVEAPITNAPAHGGGAAHTLRPQPGSPVGRHE